MDKRRAEDKIDTDDRPQIDPTANVLALVDMQVKRLDDIAELRSVFEEKMLKQSIEAINDTIRIRAEHQKELSLAESKRIDAIRAVDVGAVAIASERAAQQATVLANQVAASAETLRALVATTAQTVASQLASVSGSLTERIAVLEKTSYVGSGKQAIADPMLAELVTEMKSLRDEAERRGGKSLGSSSMWGYIVGGIGAVLGLTTLITVIVHMVKP
jgi:hypothetical protein